MSSYSKHIRIDAVTSSQSRTKVLDTDVNLISKCIKGDTASFKLLYERHKKQLFVVCYRYMGSSHDAEEVLQEGFIKIHRDLYQFDSNKGVFISWAKRVCVNTALEHLRKKKMIKVELNGYHIVDNFEDQLFNQLTVDEILRIIMKLPGGYRTVINMYLLEGYSHNEIAESLNISVSTSKSQLHKAKAKLRNLLLESHPELSKRYAKRVRT